MNNKRKPAFLSAGLSSILLVVVLLCMITFSVLSLSAANADHKLSEKTAHNTAAYYEGYSEASKKLKDIDETLLSIYNSSKSEEEYKKTVAKEFQEDLKISFSETIGDGDTLHVTLKACWPEKTGDTLYEIEQWERERENISAADETAGGLNVLWKN